MSCCTDSSDQNNKGKEDCNPDKSPKSFVGKYLHNLGKKDLENEKQKGEQKGGCC